MTSVPQQRPPHEDQHRSAFPDGAPKGSESIDEKPHVAEQPVFRAFSISEFHETPSWRRLVRILTSNGGSYGLYGPRGSGKTWLMMRAITEANSNGGLGLWFPCPSRYGSDAFLSTLSDNLASAVENRFVRNSSLVLALRRGQALLLGLIVVPVTIAVVTYAIHDVATVNSNSASRGIASTLPNWLWILVEAALALLISLYTIRFIQDRSKRGHLVREATAIRERIRFTTGLKFGSEVGVSGGQSLAATFKRSREKALDERPTTVASLIFDFRNLAEHIAASMARPLVIGIDELDKIEDADAVRELLRDIKGIFEVTGVHFLVSISDEAAAALQLGTLQPGGRNEFNSSFYTVIELPALGPHGAYELLQARGFGDSGRLAAALCLLSGGNRRELIRMADLCALYADSHERPRDERTIVMLLEKESLALLNEIIRAVSDDVPAGGEDNVKYGAWTALPRASFDSSDKFVRLGLSAIREFWRPYWADDRWLAIQEPWRRLLVRLFISAKLLDTPGQADSTDILDERSAVIDLRDILLMATNDAGVAKLMLESRFGEDLSGAYRR
jgi:KAP family P-loop domain